MQRCRQRWLHIARDLEVLLVRHGVTLPLGCRLAPALRVALLLRRRRVVRHTLGLRLNAGDLDLVVADIVDRARDTREASLLGCRQVDARALRVGLAQLCLRDVLADVVSGIDGELALLDGEPADALRRRVGVGATARALIDYERRCAVGQAGLRPSTIGFAVVEERVHIAVPRSLVISTTETFHWRLCASSRY